MFQHYSVFNSKEKALEHPYPNMNKEEWTRVCDLFASEEFQRRSAINKENRAKLKIEKMEALQLQHESEGKSYTKWRSSLRCWDESGLRARYGAEDARAFADDGGVATEERRRADADDGRAATEKRRRAPEDDGEQQRTLVEQQKRSM
ncbi:hypothetical protein CJ030_MR2G019402 [Morella rubra]|uniref:Uncharacterized protein n=1 Tax=Morella rubra TaxID=262757 RepID=A0A6A1WGE9_9ROSI|nr:hypothetical protein CJ030_MR2G019402 [Morella rubra]